jgi:crotonobetainyl-CoA:carnitine CoA-transferase CaiB-like acyl-CoA transferase
MTRLGLDFTKISEINPRIIYVNAPGYGVTGPYARRPAYAPSIAAAAGFPLTNLGITSVQPVPLGIEEIRPMARRLGAAGAQSQVQADGIAATVVGSAIALGLYARDRGAGPLELFTSMLNSGAHMNSAVAVEWQDAPPVPKVDEDLNGFGPLYRIYEAAEGSIFLAAPSPGDWTRLCAALAEFADLAADPRFGDETGRREHEEQLAAILSGIFSSRTADRWEQLLLGRGVGCVRVANKAIEAILIDTPLGEQSGYLASVVDPLWDEYQRQAALVRLSRSTTQTMPACMVGQHSDALLAELGYTADAIAEAREAQIIA